MHDGRKCLSNLLQLEPCNDQFNVISDVMAYWYDTFNTFNIAIKFSNAKIMNCALMFIMSNHYARKCLSV